MKRFRLLLPVVLLALVVPAWSQEPHPLPPKDTNPVHFPYEISVVARSNGYLRGGDSIQVLSVRGTKPKIEAGGAYLVQGVYKLASESRGTLALSLTTRYNHGVGPWGKLQVCNIEQGTGSFALAALMPSSGEYHVSFYLPNDPSNRHGGMYFSDR